MKKHLSLIAIALLLTACGSGGDDAGSAAATGTQQTAVPQADSFMNNVNAAIGTSSETAEPVAIDASPSAPEDTEPSPVS